MTIKPYMEDRSMEGLVYLLFMQERTQKEASEFIYDRDYSNINLQTFRNARKNLVEDGYIEEGESKRNTKYKSLVDPLVEKTNENYKEHHEGELSDSQLDGLRMIYDSDWFRSFFSLENIEKLWYIKRKEESNRLTYDGHSGVLKAIGQVLKDANGFSCRIHPIQGYKGPTLADLTDYDSFENFADSRNWFMKEIESYVECWREGLDTQDISLFPNMTDNITRHQIFKIICEGHNIPEGNQLDKEKRPSIHLLLVFDLVYESGLLFQLPNLSGIGIPGRKHSRFYAMSSDLRKVVKDSYILNRPFEEDMASALNKDEEIFSNIERIDEILEELSLEHEIQDKTEIIKFLQGYQEHGLPYLNW